MTLPPGTQRTDYLGFGATAEIITAPVQVISRRSPTLTCFNAALSSTREVYFQLFGPDSVIDGIAGSMAVIVAETLRWAAAVAPGRLPPAGVSDSLLLSISFSSGLITRSTMFS